MGSGGWERLGAKVTAERVRRGYRSINAFAEASGLSSSTLDNLENHRKTSYTPSTLSLLEHALGWRTGSVELVLAGGEPEVEDDPDLAAILDMWPRLSAGTRRTLRILAVEAARVED